jgi:RHS repeat-associated protein
VDSGSSIAHKLWRVTDLKTFFQYDRDGRVKDRSSPSDSSGSPSTDTQFIYEVSGIGQSVPGSDSVFNTVSVNGGYYLYYFDVRNDRIRKEHPTGAVDEFFWTPNHELLEDRGNTQEVSGTPALDEYVWLGGRPVMMWRNQFNSSWVRTADGSSGCMRYGEPGNCAPYFPITDLIGKPIAMLVSTGTGSTAGRLSGVGEYDPFGYVNRVWSNYETPHPYANSTTYTSPNMGDNITWGLAVQDRVNLGVVDTESCHLALNDPIYVKDHITGNNLAGPYGGYHKGQMWSSWVTPTSTTPYVYASMTTSSQNCNPINCSCGTNWYFSGFTIPYFEYRMYDSTTTPVWTPLRFPGHYYDSETDLFENWHRFYDPFTGRYLQPEPMLQDPEFVVERSSLGEVFAGRSHSSVRVRAQQPDIVLRSDWIVRARPSRKFTRWQSERSERERRRNHIPRTGGRGAFGRRRIGQRAFTWG